MSGFDILRDLGKALNKSVVSTSREQPAPSTSLTAAEGFLLSSGEPTGAPLAGAIPSLLAAASPALMAAAAPAAWRALRQPAAGVDTFYSQFTDSIPLTEQVKTLPGMSDGDKWSLTPLTLIIESFVEETN